MSSLMVETFKQAWSVLSEVMKELKNQDGIDRPPVFRSRIQYLLKTTWNPPARVLAHLRVQGVPLEEFEGYPGPHSDDEPAAETPEEGSTSPAVELRAESTAPAAGIMSETTNPDGVAEKDATPANEDVGEEPTGRGKRRKIIRAGCGPSQQRGRGRLPQSYVRDRAGRLDGLEEAGLERSDLMQHESGWF